MVECAAVGAPPHLFYDYTLREIHALMRGSALAARRHHKVAAFGAYQGAVFHQNKRAPQLYQALLRRLEPARDMTHGALRSAIMAMAKSMGANVIVRKRSEE